MFFTLSHPAFNTGLWPLMLEMTYHVSIDLEFRMTEIAVWLLSLSQICLRCSPIQLDNL